MVSHFAVKAARGERGSDRGTVAAWCYRMGLETGAICAPNQMPAFGIRPAAIALAMVVHCCVPGISLAAGPLDNVAFIVAGRIR
jgi:hypothetical protein